MNPIGSSIPGSLLCDRRSTGLGSAVLLPVWKDNYQKYVQNTYEDNDYKQYAQSRISEIQ